MRTFLLVEGTIYEKHAFERTISRLLNNGYELHGDTTIQGAQLFQSVIANDSEESP